MPARWTTARRCLGACLGLGLLAGSGCVSQATHETLLRQQAATSRALADARREREQLVAQARKERELSRKLERVARRLEQRLRVARLELEIHRDRATEPARLARQLAERVAAIPGAAQAGVAVIEHRQRATIRVPGAALFRATARELTREGRALLGQLAVVMRDLGGDAFGATAPAFEVGGHTDEPIRQGAPARWDLSLARAVAVTRALEKGGVPAFRLHPTGHAGLSPLDRSGTPEARARNQRVEMVVVPQRAPGAGLFRPPPPPPPPTPPKITPLPGLGSAPKARSYGPRRRFWPGPGDRVPDLPPPRPIPPGQRARFDSFPVTTDNSPPADTADKDRP